MKGICVLLFLSIIAVVLCVLSNSLLFYEAQRSGKLPADQKVTWRKDSALDDKGNNGEDLTGGYYDAGDFVKFGFPMAYTVTVLAWGVIDYESAYSAAGSLDDARKALKWGTDYFIKAHTAANEFYGQVGQGDVDHAYWGRPEDMTMSRPAYKIDTSKPGSDLAAETAAALAATAIAYKSADSTYANNLITHAKQLFDFANNYRGKYSDSITDAKNFYASGDYKDELVWAAAWLYRATNDNTYLTKAESLYNEFGLGSWNGAFNWDNKISGVQVLLAKLTSKQAYKDKVQGYVDYLISSQKKTPKGLVYIDQWGTLRHAANSALIALQAADLGISADNYRQFAKKQIDYALGDGGRSYVVGFGTNPPVRPHHRSSSCPDAPAVCDWNTYNSAGPNAHVLTGALVGGPDQNDNYVDDRSDYVSNEVATDYNAGFQSAVAGLLALGYTSLYRDYGGSPIEGLNAIETPTNNEFFVEASVNSAGSNFEEIKALIYNESGWPARMGDKLSFKYFIDISELVKAGYSAKDVTIKTNYNAGATVSGLYPWDEAHNIYYVNVDTVVNTSPIVIGDLKLQMFNSNTQSTTNGIMPRFRLVNTGDTAVDLSTVKIRYYFTEDGTQSQNFWCDWSSVGSSNVTSTFVKMDNPVDGADTYLEIGFTSGAGQIAPGASVEVQARFSKADWSDYNQADDYSFNPTDNSYVDWTKATLYIDGKLEWGMEPYGPYPYDVPDYA